MSVETPEAEQTDQEPVDDRHQAWRGIAAEKETELSTRVGILLRARSRALLGSMIRPYRGSLLIAVAVVLVQTATSLAPPFLVSIGIDRGIPALRHHDWTPITVVTVLIVVSALADAGLRYLFLMRVGRIGQSVLLEIRRRVFNKFQTLPVAFHERYTSGRVISRLTSDLDSLNDLLEAGLDGLVTSALFVIGVGIALLLLDVPLALVVIGSFPFLYLLLRWFRKHSAVAYRKTREAIALLIVHFVETINGIRAVQTFRREKRNEEIFAQLNDDYRSANADAMTLLAWFVPGIKLIASVVTAVVLVYGGYRALDGSLKVGVLVAFLLYLRQFFDPLMDIAMFFNAWQSATAALEKLSGVLEEPSSVPEPENPTPLPHPAPGRIAFESVVFSYPKRDDSAPRVTEEGEPIRTETVVIPGLDLVVPAGQTVALVGATGAGKSTLARLICRFYDPTDGRVRLDGVDLRDAADDELRRAVVMVTQENFLFTGTVAENIGFGRPSAGRAEIEQAAAAIGADTFIRALPDGYDTDVRKRGGRLSAGQRQLVAFARAFLADPSVLVLDEATSSLDVPSERAVQRALRTILAERTALIIAHRLSTVEIADRVLVMSGGRIVEDGTPAELLRGGAFADLHEAWRGSLV